MGVLVGGNPERVKKLEVPAARQRGSRGTVSEKNGKE